MKRYVEVWHTEIHGLVINLVEHVLLWTKVVGSHMFDGHQLDARNTRLYTPGRVWGYDKRAEEKIGIDTA